MKHNVKEALLDRKIVTRSQRTLAVLCALLPAMALQLCAANQSETSSGTLCVMTYNLRFASAEGPNAWPSRRPLMHELIRRISPDVIGTQEGLFHQLNDLAADLGEYRWIGVGRDDGVQKDEFMAVFYRTNRLQPLSTNHFWLSDTPEVPGSATWGNQNRRMVTAIRFRDFQTQREFHLWNTHFDHAIQVAREKSAELVRKRVQALGSDLPLLLIGDFNADAGKNKAYKLLVENDLFADSWLLAKERRGEGLGTFNGFTAIRQGGPRIDWILTRGKVTVDASEIVPFSREGRFPSDHLPVVAWLRFER